MKVPLVPGKILKYFNEKLLEVQKGLAAPTY